VLTSGAAGIGRLLDLLRVDALLVQV
jgi:hypothetical protein